MNPAFYEFAADLMLFSHALVVLFVVLGLPLIMIGGWRDWRWERNPYFRWTHLTLIGVVVLETWLDMPCPLTVWERQLRELAGDASFQDGEFITYWVSKLLFYTAPGWVFDLIYTVFGALVVISWWVVRPRQFAK